MAGQGRHPLVPSTISSPYMGAVGSDGNFPPSFSSQSSGVAYMEKLKDPQTVRSVLCAALDGGYSLVDTASVYKNEHVIGEILSSKYLNRSIFVTSKLAPSDHGYESTLQACQRSLEALRRTHLDAYLVHWPGVAGRPREDVRNPAMRKETWRAMEELYRQGTLSRSTQKAARWK